MIDAKTIVDAFRRTGIRPVKGKFFDTNAACAIGVLYLEKHEKPNCNYNTTDWFVDNFKVSWSFTSGLTQGFDGYLPHNDRNQDYMQGYVVGKEVNEIMFKDKKND